MPKSDPIKVFAKDGEWLVSFGKNMHLHFATREQAIEEATRAAAEGQRELQIEAEQTPPSDT